MLARELNVIISSVIMTLFIFLVNNQRKSLFFSLPRAYLCNKLAGDLLREEQKREGSKYGELIQNYIRDGLIVPMEVTIALLETAMKESIEKLNKTRFLIDGFPRKMDQAEKFEETVVESKFVLYFSCSEQTLLDRLLKRGETSGRVDDNIESIKKRFQVFKETSFPVIEAFEAKNKVRQVQYIKRKSLKRLFLCSLEEYF